MYYWYWGTWAMHLMGGNYGKNWNDKLVKAICESQIQDTGCARGSWDPCGVWGEDGGRVYSTALMALCLETPQRYRLNLSSR